MTDKEQKNISNDSVDKSPHTKMQRDMDRASEETKEALDNAGRKTRQSMDRASQALMDSMARANKMTQEAITRASEKTQDDISHASDNTFNALRKAGDHDPLSQVLSQLPQNQGAYNPVPQPAPQSEHPKIKLVGGMDVVNEGQVVGRFRPAAFDETMSRDDIQACGKGFDAYVKKNGQVLSPSAEESAVYDALFLKDAQKFMNVDTNELSMFGVAEIDGVKKVIQKKMTPDGHGGFRSEYRMAEAQSSQMDIDSFSAAVVTDGLRIENGNDIANKVGARAPYLDNALRQSNRPISLN